MTDPDQVDELLSRVPRLPPLSAAQVARIRARIPASASPRPFARRFALAGALGLVLVASAALAMYLIGAPGRAPAVLPAPAPEPAPPAPSPPPIRLTMPDDVPPPPPVVVEAPVPPVRATAPALAKEPAVPLPADIAGDRESALGAESKMIATALRQLRGQLDPRAALATLDDHAGRFPRGALAAEARAVRIEALVAAGERARALALLDGSAANGEQLVLRGELRLEAGRVEEAARDFATALIGAADAIEQRALYGRAACRVRLGDHAAARRDLDDYLRRFPKGASARAARTALDRIR